MADDKLAVVSPDVDDLLRLSKMFYHSGRFKNIESIAQAGVQILAGREIGFGPFASMNGIHIIKGKPNVGANLMATALDQSDVYDYDVLESTNELCSIRFWKHKRGEWCDLGTYTYTTEDARLAKLLDKDNWKKDPRSMCFSRAISKGIKMYAPGVFSGGPVYTPDEMDNEAEFGGEIIDVTPVSPGDNEPPIGHRHAPPDSPPTQPATDPTLDALAQAAADLGGIDAEKAVQTANVINDAVDNLHWMATGDYFKFEDWARDVHGLTKAEVGEALNEDMSLTKEEAADKVWYYAKEKAEAKAAESDASPKQ